MNYRPVLLSPLAGPAVWAPRVLPSFLILLTCCYVLPVAIAWFHVKPFLPAFSWCWFSWPCASRERQVVVWAVSLHGLGERGAVPWPRGRPGVLACRFCSAWSPALRGPDHARCLKNRLPRPSPRASSAIGTHRPGGAARSPRPVSTAQTASPAATPAAAGPPAPDPAAIRARGTAARMRRASRRGRRWRMRAGISSTGRAVRSAYGSDRPGQPDGSGVRAARGPGWRGMLCAGLVHGESAFSPCPPVCLAATVRRPGHVRPLTRQSMLPSGNLKGFAGRPGAGLLRAQVWWNRSAPAARCGYGRGPGLRVTRCGGGVCLVRCARLRPCGPRARARTVR